MSPAAKGKYYLSYMVPVPVYLSGFNESAVKVEVVRHKMTAPMVPVPVYLSGFDESAVKVEIVGHNDGSYGTVPVYLSGFDESAVKVEIVRHNDGSYGTGYLSISLDLTRAL